MSLLDWFTRKPSKAAHDAGGARAAQPEQAARPLLSPTPNSAWKNERMERRELLYGVVRNAMIRAGILSASYKFKVLSLDPRGREFVVMMDLASECVAHPGRLSGIEALISEAAKNHHEIVVKAVYWRIKDFATTSPAAPYMADSSVVPDKIPAIHLPPESPPAPRSYDPIAEDEVMAFKRAVAAAQGGKAKPAAFSQTGAAVSSGPLLSPARPTDHEAPDKPDVDAHAHILGNTQYGTLT